MGFVYLSEQNSYSSKNSAGSSDAPILEWVKKKKCGSKIVSMVLFSLKNFMLELRSSSLKT